MTLVDILRVLDDLEHDELQILRQSIEARLQDKIKDRAQPSQSRIPGLFADVGETWTSDDFDDELPDDFWFGQDE